MSKEGYQPIKTKKTIKIIPPNTGSNVHMKKDGYTWEDLDRSYWEGFDTAKNNMEKQIKEFKKKNAELKLKLEALDGQTPWKDIEDKSKVIEKLSEAKEIIKKFLDNVEPYSIDNDVLVEAEKFLKSIEV